MKKLIYISFFILVSLPSIGQTVFDCSIDYHDKYKKIEFSRMRYQITKKTSDSLRAILERELQACLIGKKMEDYSLVGRSGRSYTAANLQGKVVLFNFWSVSCGPCIVEIPMLNRLYASYKENKDFVLISILLDDENKLDTFLQRGLIRDGIKYEVVPNDKITIKEKLKFVKAMPTNLFVDREGKIYMRTVGALQDEEDFEKIRSIIDKELVK